MKKLRYLLGMAVMAALTFTSCLDNDGKENTYYIEDFYTVTGTLANGYILYSDNGSYVTLDQSAFINDTGFGNTERVYMTAIYSESMITADGKGLTNPEVSNCIVINTANPIKIDEANAQKVLEADSCASVASLNCWAYRGYLTVAPTAYYGKARPTLNLVYDPATVRNDSIDMELCYNTHNSPISGSGIYYTSFRLEPLTYVVPGANDVIVTIKCKGRSDFKLKVPRVDFRKGGY